jgi:hypothetical protein
MISSSQRDRQAVWISLLITPLQEVSVAWDPKIDITSFTPD